MEQVELDTDVDFRVSLINTLVKEINVLSQCTYPIVTPLEIRYFIDTIECDINAKIISYKNKYGANHMDDVFYFVKEYCIKRYFNEILKYVNYPKKFSDNESKSIEKE